MAKVEPLHGGTRALTQPAGYVRPIRGWEDTRGKPGRPRPHMVDQRSEWPLPGPFHVALVTEARASGAFGIKEGVVIAELAEVSPVIVAGGGFEDVARPLRRGVPTWRGTAAPTLPLSLILTSGPLSEGRSVEGVCKTLEHMAGGLIGDREPPRLVLSGKALPTEAKTRSRRWVIAEPPEWDTSPTGVIRHETRGYRLRQYVNVVLMLAAGDDPLEAAKGASRPKSRYRFIKAKKNDTFEKIAKRELGTKRLAHKLAELNGRGGASVSVKLKTGARIKLPVGDLLDEWKRDLKKAK